MTICLRKAWLKMDPTEARTNREPAYRKPFLFLQEKMTYICFPWKFMRQKIYSPCFFLRVLDVPDDEPDKGGGEKLGGEVENTEGGAEELKKISIV